MGFIKSSAVVASELGENAELVDHILSNSDNISDEAMTYVVTGPDQGFEALTKDGIVQLRELIEDIRTWPGGIADFLKSEMCEADMIERIMKDEIRKSDAGSAGTVIQ
jgi:hypothetical protein